MMDRFFFSSSWSLMDRVSLLVTHSAERRDIFGSTLSLHRQELLFGPLSGG